MIQTLVQQLGEHLQRDADQHAFVLLDPLLREPFPPAWEAAAQAPTWPVPVRHPAVGPDQRPRLLQLEACNVALLQASAVAASQELHALDLEHVQGYCIGGWLLADASTSGSAVARHLARCMQTFAGAAHPAGLIRWPDRRVLEWMWPVLTAAQQAHLLEPLIDWSVLDRRGQLQHYRAPPDTPAAENLLLTVEQWRHAEQSEAAQDLIRGWLGFTDDLPADYLPRVTSAVNTVNASGLNSRQDQALLGAYVLQIHPRLTAHPRVRQAIERALAGECSLAQALEQIPDPQGWDAIRDELSGGIVSDAPIA